MNHILEIMHSEFLKIAYTRTAKIVVILVIFFQGILAYVGVRQIMAVGLDATPETNEFLIEAIPPVRYLGFDVVIFGIIPMVVLGAVYGALEYKSHSMRTTLTTVMKRGNIFWTKLLMIVSVAIVISFVSIFCTIVITHISLGKDGLQPVVFNVFVWKYIVFAVIAWVFLTLLSFILAALFRTEIVPLLFLIPQIYNLGDFLAEHFYIGKILPVSLSVELVATSEHAMTKEPLHNILLLLLWILPIGMIAYIRFAKSDLGGKY